MFNTVKRICTCLIALCLIALFTLPSLYLSRFADATIAAIDGAERAVAEGNADALRRQTALLHGRAEQSAGTLRLFLSHDVVDDMALAVALIDPAAEDETLRSTLSAARAAIEHLRSIELFQWDTLL